MLRIINTTGIEPTPQAIQSGLHFAPIPTGNHPAIGQTLTGSFPSSRMLLLRSGAGLDPSAYTLRFILSCTRLGNLRHTCYLNGGRWYSRYRPTELRLPQGMQGSGEGATELRRGQQEMRCIAQFTDGNRKMPFCVASTRPQFFPRKNCWRSLVIAELCTFAYICASLMTW